MTNFNQQLNLQSLLMSALNVGNPSQGSSRKSSDPKYQLFMQIIVTINKMLDMVSTDCSNSTNLNFLR